MKKLIILLLSIMSVLLLFAACDTSGSTAGGNGCEHSWGDWLEVKKATCIEEGANMHICLKCQHSEMRLTNPLGHRLGEYISDNNVTPEKDGTKTAKCIRCNVTDTIIDIGSHYTYGLSDFNYIKIENGYEITGVKDKNITTLIIPSSVISIGNSAFANCTKLTSITIPNSVTSIGEYAFYKCFNLSSIVLPNGITSIEKGCFNNCLSLSTIIIPNNVISIGDWAFYECYNLKSITIPDNIISIGDDVFAGCTKLHTTIYDNAEYIGNENNSYVVLLKSTSKDITSCQINETTRFINSNAFHECKSLRTVIIPNNVTSIGAYSFGDCYELKTVTLGNSLALIGDSAFINCALDTISIPDSVTVIGEGAFMYCGNLTSATLGNTVKSIGESAFWGCKKLTIITIPNSVNFIGRFVFEYCSYLTINYLGTETEWNSINGVPENIPSKIIISTK